MPKAKRKAPRKRHGQGLARTLRLRRVLVLNLAVFLFVGWGFIGEMMRSQTIDVEIERLNDQVGELEERNTELARMSDRLVGSALLEREARLKLNLRRPGEEVVIIRGEDPAAGQLSAVSPLAPVVEEAVAEESVSNYHKWIRHFFPTE